MGLHDYLQVMKQDSIDFCRGEVKTVIIRNLDLGSGGLVAIDFGHPVVEVDLNFLFEHFDELFAVVFRVDVAV